MQWKILRKNQEEEENMSRDCTKRSEIRFQWIRLYKVDSFSRKKNLPKNVTTHPIPSPPRTPSLLSSYIITLGGA